MHINMKYYIVTISAIFISLGIGVLIGFNLNSDETFLNQQDQIIGELEGNFKTVKGKNEELENEILDLTKENENLNKYIENTYGYVINNKLLGKNIGIIQTTEDYFYPNTKDFINKATGNVAFEIVIKDKVLEDTDFAALSKELAVQINNKDEFVKYICKVAYEDKNADMLNLLAEKGFIEVKNSNLNYEKLDYVVLEGGSSQKDKNDTKVNTLDKNIINYFTENNVKLIGTERTDVEKSYIPFYKKQKLSTVDNINEIAGQISLIFVLEGKNGNFGSKATAEEFTPLEIK